MIYPNWGDDDAISSRIYDLQTRVTTLEDRIEVLEVAFKEHFAQTTTYTTVRPKE